MILILDRGPFFPANLFFPISTWPFMSSFLFRLLYIFSFLFGLQKHTAASSEVKTRILSELK